MRKFKSLTLILCLMLVCFTLTGCIGSVSQVEIKEDGSGTFNLSFGFTQEGLQMLESMGSEKPTDLTEFTYNGMTYYGEKSNYTFTSCEDFNQKISEAFSEIDGGQAQQNVCVLTKNADGSFVLKFNGQGSSVSPEAFESQLVTMELDAESEAAIKEMLKEMVVVFEFNFPYPVVQTSSDKIDGVLISGNKVSFDLVKISTAFAELGKTDMWVEVTSKKDNTVSTPNKIETNSPVVIAPIENNGRFTDVNPSDWFYTAVNAMADEGLVSGIGNNQFNPNGQITYAEFCQIIAKAEGEETGAINGYWAGKAIKLALDWSYIPNLGEINVDNYNKPITREIAIAGVYRVARQFLTNKDNSINMLSIPDIMQVSEDYRNDILYSYQTGLTRGLDEKGTFYPNKTLTRAEVCQLIYNSGFLTK